jgi:hypothetical protein
MAYNLKKEHDREHLRRSMDWSWNQLKPYREKRHSLVADYCGTQYGKVGFQAIEGRADDQIANFMFQTASIYRSWLVANRPQVKIHASSNKKAAFAKRFEVNLNELIKIINLQQTISMTVLNALFKIGICKVGLGSSEFVKLDDDSYSDPGFPFAEAISLDNWNHDMEARSLRKCRWMMDYYEIDIRRLDEEKIFNKETRDKLIANNRDMRDTQRTELLGRDTQGPHGTKDCVRLVDIWCPNEQVIYTMDDKLMYAPLNVVDYSGNSEGPYKFLCFDEVPDNTMPIGPLENIQKLAQVTNSLLRKGVDQARRAKQVMAYEAGSDQDAKKISDARDGEYISVTDVERIKPMFVGAVDQNTYAFAIGAQKLLDRMGGNVQTLGGLGPQSDSVGQEQIIKQQVGALMQNMQSRVVKFTSDVCSELGWHLWHDQVGMKRFENLAAHGLPEIEVDMSLNPGQREGDFADYSIEVEPYSMAYQSPGERLGMLNNIVMNMVFPLTQTPFAQQSGMSIDVKALVDKIADLSNLPELRNVVTFAGVPMNDPPSASQGAAHKPQREYVHRSASSKGGDDMGSELQMMGNASKDNKYQ